MNKNRLSFLFPYCSLVLLMALLIVLQGCSKGGEQEGEQESTGEMILFNVDDLSSRGGVTTLSNLSGFGIFAYYNEDQYNEATSTPNYIYNVAVTKSGSDWVYTPLRFWPIQGVLSFFAYSPHSSNSEGSLTVSGASATGRPELSYTTPDDITKQLDILSGTPIYDSTDRDSKVSVSFKHVLSRITFSGGLSEALPAGVSIKIKEIEIGDLKNRGSYRFDSWTIASDAVAKSYKLSITGGLLGDMLLTTTPQSIVTANSDLFILPQPVEESALIKVVAIYNRGGVVDERTFERRLSSITTNLWEGKSYSITLKINPEMDFSIKCEVKDWTIKNIDIPPFE